MTKKTDQKPKKKEKSQAKAKEPAKKKKNKKDAQFVLRIDRETRDQFTEICDELDTSAAREVRKFMKKFIKQYHAGELDDA